jgi:hypothetical protein
MRALTDSNEMWHAYAIFIMTITLCEFNTVYFPRKLTLTYNLSSPVIGFDDVWYTTIIFLWLYSPILGLGRLHETFRFISVTRSSTVGRTPWKGDQLVARPLLTAPGDCDDREVGGMNGFGRGNRSTRRKPVPTPCCRTQIPLVRPLQLWRGHIRLFSYVNIIIVCVIFINLNWLWG